MITKSGKNDMLDGPGLAPAMTHSSLHSAFPGELGANELAGGGYARQARTWGAAVDGVLTATDTPVTFDVPAGTVAWIGEWNALAAGDFKNYAPAGGDPQEYRVDVASNEIDQPGHGYVDDQALVWYGATPPAPLVEGTTYYVLSATADRYKVAAIQGGADPADVIDLTDAGSVECRVSIIVPEVFAAAGQYQVNLSRVDLNYR